MKTKSAKQKTMTRREKKKFLTTLIHTDGTEHGHTDFASKTYRIAVCCQLYAFTALQMPLIHYLMAHVYFDMFWL